MASASAPPAAAALTRTPPPGERGEAQAGAGQDWGEEGRALALTWASRRSARLPYQAPVSVMPVATSDQEGDSSFGKYGRNAYV